jgi:hypothetical protein
LLDANDHALAVDVTDLERDHLGGAQASRGCDFMELQGDVKHLGWCPKSFARRCEREDSVTSTRGLEPLIRLFGRDQKERARLRESPCPFPRINLSDRTS